MDESVVNPPPPPPPKKKKERKESKKKKIKKEREKNSRYISILQTSRLALHSLIKSDVHACRMIMEKLMPIIS